MPLVVSGQEFFTATEVAQDVGVVRQTLWRWRQEGKIPAGSRYRGRQILYTRAELVRIRQFANRVEPLVSDAADR
jgi:predicted site-specific integrase-resolvase